MPRNGDQYAIGMHDVNFLRKDSAMKKALLSLAVVGLVSLGMTEIASAQNRVSRHTPQRQRLQSNYRFGPSSTVLKQGQIVFGAPRSTASRHYSSRYRYYPPQVHRHYYPSYQRSCVPSYRPSYRSPYFNPSGIGFSNGRVGFWIGF